MLQDRGQWDLSGDIIDCFRRYSSELSPEEQEEIIKGIEEGLTDQDVKDVYKRQVQNLRHKIQNINFKSNRKIQSRKRFCCKVP